MQRNIAWIGALAAFAWALPLVAQHTADPVELDTGARIYSSTCNSCHGPDGDQVAGVDLKKGQFRHASSDDDLARVIQDGIPGTAMPPNNVGRNLVALVAYLHAMRDFKTRKVALGDARHGQVIFEGKGRCTDCHRVHGKGSHLALDLSDIGSTRTPSYLDDALLDPQSTDLPQHRFIRAVTRTGEVITGRRLNEDTLTLQIMDSRERLLSLSKADLKEYAIEKDPRMPSFRDKLSDAERADLIAYLVSLKGPVNVGEGSEPGGRGQVTYQRLLDAGREPQNWLTYSGTYSSRRYTTLDQVTPVNVKNLEMKWMFQADSTQKMEATPIVVDGVMYVTQPPNDVVALDARTGRIFWVYQYRVSPDARVCCGQVNRGLAIHGDTLFMGTIDAHLVALDSKNGRLLWDTQVADPKLGYSITQAPLVVKDKVVVGPAGGEYGIRGFFAAYDAATGHQAWRFYTVPGPGEPGNETWAGDSWKHGSAGSWVTGSYDPDLNLVYWGTTNPGPDYNPDVRAGDNLYSCSVVALDADTGKLKWYFQFTPHDSSDWDAAQVPVLADMDWNGARRKVMLWANRNGFFYVLDRATGKFLRGSPFVHQNWAAGLDENGRPIRSSNTQPTLEGVKLYPGMQGGTNWYSPSWSPHTGLFYVAAWKDYYTYFSKLPATYNEGQNYFGGATRSTVQPIRRGPINTWTDVAGHGEIIALDPSTGKEKWAFPMHDVTDSGILTTATDLLFTGSREGYFWALDARTGAALWHATTGGQISSTAISYMVDGKQYVAISANHGLFAFALR